MEDLNLYRLDALVNTLEDFSIALSLTSTLPHLLILWRTTTKQSTLTLTDSPRLQYKLVTTDQWQRSAAWQTPQQYLEYENPLSQKLLKRNTGLEDLTPTDQPDTKISEADSVETEHGLKGSNAQRINRIQRYPMPIVAWPYNISNISNRPGKC
jgi:hypothetical protein